MLKRIEDKCLQILIFIHSSSKVEINEHIYKLTNG